MFVIHNNFDISIIFTLLIPIVAFILLPTKKMIVHVGIYFVLLAGIFIYGYSIYETHSLLYSMQNMSAYVIALLFVIAFGTFYHIAIERSYKELEYANYQKTFLLKEIHHRVKNNLNLIASILGIQGLESSSSEIHELIEQNKLRLESIALAHEMLYKQDNLANIDLKSYIEKLTAHILKTNEGTENIKVHIEMISLKLPIENMIQFGIMINELMINSIIGLVG
ncbi:MAG: sensor histidine kinase [Epsilonproteobacteria bacterium]|nr:sensor histidine kinase [Campylobacterota bacterium]